jgi:integrase
LLDYFNELLDSHSWSAVKLDLYGLRFFYTQVLNKTWHDIPLIKPPKTARIPDILSIDQVNRLFDATNRLSYKVFFFTLYSMGLRLGEGIRLTVGDIDSLNMRVHIRNAKGNKDRLVPLPENTLSVLRKFWSVHKHPHFLFPNRKRGLKNARLVDLPLERGGIQSAMKAVVSELGIKKSPSGISMPRPGNTGPGPSPENISFTCSCSMSCQRAFAGPGVTAFSIHAAKGSSGFSIWSYG